MKTVKQKAQVLSAACSLSLLLSCNAAKDSEDETTNSTDSGNKLSTVTDVKSLNLSSNLKVTLPKAFDASGSSLRLLAGKKSSEACMMGSTIKQSIRALGEVAGFFCHIEVEKDKIKFGKKYKITAQGNEFARIYIDDSKASEGKLSIGFCSNNRSEDGMVRGRQQINIDSLTDNGPKGNLVSGGQSVGSDAMSYGRSIVFDMSTSGQVILSAKDKFSGSGSTFMRQVGLELKEAGVSTLKLANKGTMNGGGEFYDRGYAYMGTEDGSAIFQSKGEFEGQTFEFARRSYFNSAGEVVTATEVDADLKPKVTDLPEYLPTNFAPDAFTGWVGQDCPDFDEEIALDVGSAAHTACNQGEDDSDMSECYSQDSYEDSSESISL